MTEDTKQDLRPCPFCGKQHKTNKIAPVVDYDGMGKPILGEYKDVVSLETHRHDAYIPVDIWQIRPLEDALQKKLEIAMDTMLSLRHRAVISPGKTDYELIRIIDHTKAEIEGVK